MFTTYEAEIEQVVQSVFSTMLNMDLAREDVTPELRQESLVAMVQIAGQWTGSVVLMLSPELASASAVTMLQIAPQDVTQVDRQDCAAELANMVGGNIKSMLPSPSFLSLPTIVSGRDFGLKVHDSVMIDDLTMASAQGKLRVRLFGQLPATERCDV